MPEPLSIVGDPIARLAALFRLLGDPSRLSVAVSCMDAPISVSDVAARTGLSQSLVSHHLSQLRGARIVRAERRGRRVFYSADDGHVRMMIAAMAEHVGEAG